MFKFLAGLCASLIFFAHAAAYSPDGKISVTMLNVGQGDSFLIETPTQNVLIDAGDVKDRNKLLAELRKAGVTRFEKIILTHAHADHIGGLQIVLANFVVDKIYDNGFDSPSPFFKKYRDAPTSFGVLRDGVALDLGGATFKVLHPTERADKINNQSIVGKLTFKKFSMLFTGDLEKDAEEQLIQRHNVRATVLKAGHHGSKTSSSNIFLGHVLPNSILISCDVQNRFKHPHKVALRRMKFFTDDIYCSAFNGTVKIISDGNKFIIEPEDNIEWLEYYLDEKATCNL